MAPRLVSDRLVEDLFAQKRSPGKHVSTAIKRVMAELYPDRFDNNEPIAQTRLDLGNAMERAIADEYADRFPYEYVRPGELELDDITGTPDLWNLPYWCTIEIKLTWASSSRADDPEDSWFFRYWSQLKSYVYMAGQEVGRLIVVFLNGNYRYGDPDSKPTAREWEDTWSQEELQENWEMIKSYAEHEGTSSIESSVARVSNSSRKSRKGRSER